MDFRIDGLEEALSSLEEGFKGYEEEKKKELKKIGFIAGKEIKPLIPVDTGLLRNSLNSQLIDSDTVETGVNLQYGPHVNYGHMKIGVDVSDSSTYRGMRKHSPESFVKGKFFMERGMNNAKPQIEKELNRWTNELIDKMQK